MTPTRLRCTALALALMGAAASAGEPGRLEADADFLLGNWSSDCGRGVVRFFLADGALRQQGLLRIVPKGSDQPVTPVTLLAATRDGPGLTLEAASDEGGFAASVRYTASITSNDAIVITAMTVCRDDRCASQRIEAPWLRCPG